MANVRVRGAQYLTAVALIALGVRSVINSQDDLVLKPIIWDPNWTLVGQGVAATILSYLILIWSTGEIIRGWEIRVTTPTILRLWIRSNLERYVPRARGLALRLLAIAESEKLPPKYITGSALHPPLVWLGTGAAVGAVLLAFYRYGNTKIYLPLLLLGALGILVVVFGLAGTDLPRRIAQSIGRPETMRPADAESLGIGIVANLLAWLAAGYGLSLIGQGLLVGFRIDWMLATGALAAATVTGYLTLMLPTGLLVRELVLYALIKRDVGPGPAIAIAVALRGVMTALDLLASSYLLMRRTSRDDA